jgi:hypothetical protein
MGEGIMKTFPLTPIATLLESIILSTFLVTVSSSFFPPHDDKIKRHRGIRNKVKEVRTDFFIFLIFN